MSNSRVVNQTKTDVALRSDSTRWLATVGDEAPVVAAGYHWRRVAPNGQSPGLYLAAPSDMALPVVAERSACGVVFDGTLYNRRDLQKELGELPAGNSDAGLVLASYLRWGEDILQRLRGIFALIVRDNSRDTLLCVRDPLGIHPMFYAAVGDTVFVSPSIDILIRQPYISGAVNRAALADYLLDRFPKMEETFFASVSRLPPGHVLRLVGKERRTHRYWDPAPGGSVNWIRPEELGRFDELLEAAANRCLDFGPTGIFL